MANLRTRKTHLKYMKLIAGGFLENGCGLCQRIKTVREFKYWRIITNLFPYDRISRIHHMIIPKRHISEKEISEKEKKEYELIKEKYIEKKYEFIVETTKSTKSIPEHFHIHLIIAKKESKKNSSKKT